MAPDVWRVATPKIKHQKIRHQTLYLSLTGYQQIEIGIF